MTRDEFLAQMRIEREQVWTAIAGLSEEVLTRPGVNGDWSAKDILAHLAYWEEDARRRIELVAANQSNKIRYYGSDEQIDETNAEVLARRRAWTPQEAMDALRDSRERLLDAIKKLSDEELQAKPSGIPIVDWLAADTFEHDQEHLTQILAWKQRLGFPVN